MGLALARRGEPALPPECVTLTVAGTIPASPPPAAAAIGVFLAINGYRLVADKLGAIRTMFALAAGELDEPALAAWIAQNSVPITSQNPAPKSR